MRVERRGYARLSSSMKSVGASVLLAALFIGASVAAVTWTVEAAVLRQERSARSDAVRNTLQVTRDLISARQQTAANEASRLANRLDVQSAFVRRAPAALVAIARAQPEVGFVLWDGRRLGAASRSDPVTSVRVYARGHFQGRVSVIAAPDDGLLSAGRKAYPHTRLFYSVGGRVSASSPFARGASAAQLLRHTVNDVLVVGRGRAAPRVYASLPQPRIPVRRFWPFLLGLFAVALSIRVLPQRLQRRRTDAPPNHVRDAVALVGETLAATHNSQALLPVILQAAVEATGATGGTITAAGGVTLAARGAGGPADAAILEVDLQISDEQPALMKLFPPPEGFGPGSRDAATWIGSQAVIALENASLHGQVQRQAVTDELTGLSNRRRFLTQLETELQRSSRSGSPLGIVVADLDNFKQVNDTYGHDAGDQVLRSFAAILEATVRDIDLPVRLGGEEFAVMLPDTDIVGATQLAERVRETVEATEIEGPAGVTIRLTASFGVSCYPVAARAADLLTDADNRLYEAKRHGKNTVVASVALDQAAIIAEHPSDEANQTG